jgi:integrase
MPWIRQLDSGLWAATVYTGKTPTDRITETHAIKKIVENWAKGIEADRARGTFIDPRLGKITVEEIWTLYGEGRRLERASRLRDASHWKNWVAPRWADVPIGPIRKPDVQAWVVKMERDGVGGWTIIASLALLRTLLEICVDLGLIVANPASKVKTLPPPKHVDRILTDDECDDLLANLYARFPGRAEAGLMCECMAYMGFRYEEVAAIRRRPDVIDMRHHMIFVWDVMEKDGTIKERPKSEDGGRWVPADDDLWPRLRDHILTVTPGELVFTAPGGGPLLYDNWRKRVWKRGLMRTRPMTPDEIEEWKQKRIAEGKRPWRATWSVESTVLDDPQPTPHDLRHLFGTRLAEAGMAPHERRALMGHIDERSGARYTNPREERFDRARAAMRRFRKTGS